MNTKFNFNSSVCTTRNKGGGVIKHHKVYALKGSDIFEFNSVPEAAEITGCRKDKIYKCCNGKFTSSKGFIWKYAPKVTFENSPMEVELKLIEK